MSSLEAVGDRPPAAVPARSSRWLGPDRLAIALACLWGVDGVLQLQPSMFTSAFPTQILYNAALMYQPPGLGGFLLAVARQEAAHRVLLTVVIAVVQLALVAGLLWPRTRAGALWASALWAALIWVCGQGLGFMATGTAQLESGAPGSALMYLAISLLALSGLRSGHIRWKVAGGVWSAYWAIGAVLHIPLRYSPGAVLAYNFQTAAQSQPGALSGIDYRIAQLAYSWGPEVAGALALCELAIAAAIWLPTWRTRVICAGLLATVLFWVFGQAFGGIFQGVATDLNTGPLVWLLGLAALSSASPLNSAARPRTPNGQRKRDPAMTYSPTPLPGQYHRR